MEIIEYIWRKASAKIPADPTLWIIRFDFLVSCGLFYFVPLSLILCLWEVPSGLCVGWCRREARMLPVIMVWIAEQIFWVGAEGVSLLDFRKPYRWCVISLTYRWKAQADKVTRPRLPGGAAGVCWASITSLKGWVLLQRLNGEQVLCHQRNSFHMPVSPPQVHPAAGCLIFFVTRSPWTCRAQPDSCRQTPHPVLCVSLSIFPQCTLVGMCVTLKPLERFKSMHFNILKKHHMSLWHPLSTKSHFPFFLWHMFKVSIVL